VALHLYHPWPPQAQFMGLEIPSHVMETVRATMLLEE